MTGKHWTGTALGLALAVGTASAQHPGPAPTWPRRASVGSDGAEADGPSSEATLAARGRFVAFASSARNLVPLDTNGASDVFVHDLREGTTECVSRDSSGVLGNRDSQGCALSEDGRFVAFSSRATNLVPLDTNGTDDVFVHDRLNGSTTRVSVSTAGLQAAGPSFRPSLSFDGRYVVFASQANNLVAPDTNSAADIFVHDRLSGSTTCVSVDSAGSRSNGHALEAAISGDGRFVAFQSHATNLVALDTNGREDIFVHDRLTALTERVSVDSTGAQANEWSQHPSLSADGRHVGFSSGASNLVAGDTNGWADAFVHDRAAGTTERVSISTRGAQGDDGSYAPSLSSDGRFVAFGSFAGNLVPRDIRSGWDAFVRDRQTGVTWRASVELSGLDRGDHGYDRLVFPRLSVDGREVLFVSSAPLVPFDGNALADTYVRRLFP